MPSNLGPLLYPRKKRSEKSYHTLPLKLNITQWLEVVVKLFGLLDYSKISKSKWASRFFYSVTVKQPDRYQKLLFCVNKQSMSNLTTIYSPTRFLRLINPLFVVVRRRSNQHVYLFTKGLSVAALQHLSSKLNISNLLHTPSLSGDINTSTFVSPISDRHYPNLT